MKPDEVRAELAQLTDRKSIVARAPGRVNLLGEHVDYSGSFALPLAIDRETLAAAAPRDDHRLRIRSRERGEATIDLNEQRPVPAGDWTDYARGMAHALRPRVTLRGADMVVGSDIPIESGLSSSAALALAVGFALIAIAGGEVDRSALAHAAQAAENGFVGVPSGVMDQLASAYGVRGHALLIDSLNESVVPVPLPNDVTIAVADTGVKHDVASSVYILRREETEEAARLLGVSSLRDLTPDGLDPEILPETLLRRVRHVTGENARVLATVAALHAGDLVAAGTAMNASHGSLRDEFEISTPELDLLVDTARSVEGVFGARMTGRAISGAVVMLLRPNAFDALSAALDKAFRTQYNRGVSTIEVHAAAGASLLR